jgi:hypothetical protein
LGEAFSTVPHPPKLGHIAQTVNARGFAYANRCTLQLSSRLSQNLILGIGVLPVRTADKAFDVRVGHFSFLLYLQEK